MIVRALLTSITAELMVAAAVAVQMLPATHHFQEEPPVGSDASRASDASDADTR